MKIPLILSLILIPLILLSGCINQVDEKQLIANPSMHTFNYTLHGNRDSITIQMYGGLNDYLHAKEPTLYKEGQDKIYRSMLEDKYQDKYLLSLVAAIKAKSSIPDEQAKIAVSLVQTIDYVDEGPTSYLKYPYEVLYNNHDACAGKSILLSYLLKNLGYSSVLLLFDSENHMAVGIKTDNISYEYINTGYAFIETNNPGIITYSKQKHSFGTLYSYPILISISNGLSLNSLSTEYADGIAYGKLIDDEDTLPPLKYRQWEMLVYRYGIITKEGNTITVDPSDKPLCTGNRICGGECYSACKLGEVWSCTINGGMCSDSSYVGSFSKWQSPTYSPPFDMGTLCNGERWSSCPIGETFECRVSGAVCWK